MSWPYKNFKPEEFACTHCGAIGIDERVVAKLQQLRDAYGKPIVVTSGYRCPEHPAEKHKSEPGTHALGLAADISCSRGDAYQLLKLALELNFKGIGVQQKGAGRFLHLDVAEDGFTRPTVWSY